MAAPRWLLTPKNKLYEIIERPGYYVLRSKEFNEIPTDLQVAVQEGCVIDTDLTQLIRLKLSRRNDDNV